VRIDLHSHSTASDGTDPPAEVMRRARVAGLDVIALTDHDTLAGHDEAREALPDGLTLVGGMEMSCSLGDRSVHMLAFLTDPADQDLAAELQAITTDRLRRGRAMVDRLRDLAAGQGRPEPAITLGAAALLGPPQPAARDSFIRGLTDGYGISGETAERVPITGNVSQAADRLAEYADAGVSHLVVGLVGGDEPAQCDLLAQARAALPA